MKRHCVRSSIEMAMPHHGSQVNGFAELKADGSTACGAWIYSGVFRSRWRKPGELAQIQRLSRSWLGLRVAERSPNYL